MNTFLFIIFIYDKINADEIFIIPQYVAKLVEQRKILIFYENQRS